MNQAIKNLLNDNHDQAIGRFMDEWGESADDPQTALVSIAASLRQLVAEVNQLKQVIIKNGSKS